ncbi:MAG: AAA family ATPase [Candidatus Bathyarchaeota archaeon]
MMPKELEGLKAEVLSEPILVGRKKELVELEHHLNLVIGGKGSTIFVSGKAGTGKTRFIKEFLRSIKNKEIIILKGWCFSNAFLPYFPFIEAFNSYFTKRKSQEKESKQIESEESEINEWLRGIKQTQKSGRFENLSPQVMKDIALSVVTKALLTISSKKPVVLFIDDLHWADSASLALLHYISRSISNEKILILSTFRSEELSTDEEGHQHPLIETLRLMRREDLFEEIKLQNLNQTDVSTIAENILGGSIGPEFATRLAKESNGNPLFIVESLRMLSSQGNLFQKNDQWTLSVPELEIPAKIRDIILRRVDALKPKHRKILDLASVIGEKFNIEFLAVVLNYKYLDLLETLNVIEQSSSLIICEGDSYRFDHEKSRETLYEEISLPLRRGYHEKIAEHMENSKPNSKDISFDDLAYHYSQAGNKEKSVKYTLQAGQEALSKFSNKEAIIHFKYVLQTVGENNRYSGERKVALEGLGDAYYANCLFEDAAKTFERLGNLVTGSDKLRAFRKQMDALWLIEYDRSRLMELIKRAEKFVTSNRLEMARIIRYKGASLLGLDPKVALKYHEDALQVFQEEYSLPDIAELLMVTGATRIMSGLHPKKGLGELIQSVALLHELGDVRRELEADNFKNLFYGVLFLGTVLEFAANFEHILQMAKQIGDFELLAQATMNISNGFEGRGLFKRAIFWRLKSLDYSHKTDTQRLRTEIYAGLVRQYARIGDLKQANYYFDILMEMPSEVLSNSRNALLIAHTEAVMFTTKKQWKKADQKYLEALEMSKTKYWKFLRIVEFQIRDHYVWALDLQGRSDEAKIQRELIKKGINESRKNFVHTYLHIDLMVQRKIEVDEEVELRLDLVNISKSSCSIIKIEDLIPNKEINFTELPSSWIFNVDNLEMEKTEIAPFQIKTVKLKFKPIKVGTFKFCPKITYIDDLGNIRISSPKSITVNVQQAKPSFKVLPGRVPTGSEVIDQLLFGGIPEGYAVVLTGSPSDDRDHIIKNFLNTGIREEEIVFFISTEADGLENLLENPNFILFLCNPKPKTKVPDLPNVFKLGSKTNLTNLSISLTKAFRNIDVSKKKRFCIDIISDVLISQKAEATRRWISELITDLGSKGFTMLAIIDPEMHPLDQSKAVINLFDGEISIFQSKDPLECKKSILVKKLKNQDFIKNPICLFDF